MTGPQPRRSLPLLTIEQERLGQRLAGLTAAELERPCNLAGWQLIDLGAHVTRVCDSILLATQRAAVGDMTPAFGPAAQPRADEIRAMQPAAWADLMRRERGQLGELVAGLSDDQLQQLTFPHSQGPRTIAWFCIQLLAEVGFHRWDLERSLGDEGPLDDALATYLVPFLLDPAQHLFRRRTTDGEMTCFTLCACDTAWTLTVSAEGTEVVAGAAAHGASISASAGWLSLAVYGRVRIGGPAFSIDGPPDVADRFARIFGPN